MQQSQSKQQVGGILGFIERIGNKIPDITILFISAFILVCVVSAVLAQIHFNYVHPATGRPIEITNMLSGKALVDLMSKMVTNYANFPPLSMVIVATFIKNLYSFHKKLPQAFRSWQILFFTLFSLQQPSLQHIFLPALRHLFHIAQQSSQSRCQLSLHHLAQPFFQPVPA